jgi:LmbE family N-acetylglucosaminyl deacetylase
MRWIYISPHLDDAILSAGGLIYDLWGTSSAEETVRVRRAEDEKAAEIVGAKAVHFDFLDCLYRRGRDGEWLYSNVFVPPQEDDTDFPRQIAETVNSHILQDDVLVCPLTLGSHVDHVLVRQALEMLHHPLLYYADIPYLLKYPESLGPNTAGMKENVYPVSETGLKAWVEAVNAYSSQLTTLLDTPEGLREAIRLYCEKQGGIRLWSRR